MKNKKIIRTFAATLAALLCLTAFSTTALAGGGDPSPEPLPEETGEPVTGGIELDAEDAEGGTPDAEKDEDKDGTGPEAVTDKETADLLSSLFGSQVKITVTEDGIQISNPDGEDTGDDAPRQTGIVTTNGGKLNVRTGAGTDNTAFAQLPNGTQVEVIETQENGWVKILLPERVGYVCGDYLAVSDAGDATGGDGFSLSLDGEELSALLEQFGGLTGGGLALTPDGNLSLMDDIGTTGGKQFITLQTKAGNTFYLIIDRDDEGEQTVHFLNQVDEADLMALTEDGETVPETCTCTAKCEAGAVNTACPVCKNNLTACTGPEPEATEPEADEPQEEEKSGGMGGLVVFLVVVLMGGGAALYFFKFKKPKDNTKGNDDLDEYDFGEDEDDEDEPAPEDESGTGEIDPRPLEDFLMDEDEPSKEDEE